jgi:hypothetical protein
MASSLLTLIGLVETLFPGRVVAVAERLAFRDRGEAELRSWVRPAARVEGLLWVLLARRGASPSLRLLLGFLGVPLVLAPRRAAAVGLRLAYERSETIELASWVTPATRAVGLVYVFIGVRTVRRALSTGENSETPETPGKDPDSSTHGESVPT